jgi:hypothetical protein
VSLSGGQYFDAFFAEFINAHENKHTKPFVVHESEVRGNKGEASPPLVWSVLAKFVANKQVDEGAMQRPTDRAAILYELITWGHINGDGDGQNQNIQGMPKERLMAFVTETEVRMEKVRESIVDILEGMDADGSGTIGVRELKEAVLENPGMFLSLLGL